MKMNYYHIEFTIFFVDNTTLQSHFTSSRGTPHENMSEDFKYTFYEDILKSFDAGINKFLEEQKKNPKMVDICKKEIRYVKKEIYKLS